MTQEKMDNFVEKKEKPSLMGKVAALGLPEEEKQPLPASLSSAPLPRGEGIFLDSVQLFAVFHGDPVDFFQAHTLDFR